MTTDSETTLTEIKQLINRFVEERDWLQYHDPKNLVMAMMSEVGELADQFRWVNNADSHALAASTEQAEDVADELADIMMFAIEFASVCNIDITSAIASKLDKNASRYPIAKAKGSCKKYDRL
jgi:NTP pyrophosphatase (non-canonical NTP hydrolase)